jgi:hypothetical protein
MINEIMVQNLCNEQRVHDLVERELNTNNKLYNQVTLH